MATESIDMVEEAVEFPQELLAFIDEWKTKPGSLIMILHKTQQTFGYISRPSAEKLSYLTGIPLARIYGVITFYHFFKTTKPGKYKISVCLGTACYLKGGQDLINEVRAILNIAEDEVTKDGLFSVDPVRCIGCCGLAPVMTIGTETYGKLTKEQLPGIIAQYYNKAEKRTSAPAQ
ncbi:MAG: NAD(P)H-dependent oxidoreductase subunit E [Spirochaetaceae bacterium]|jgi:NADH-quinone oxidoreductase subunit E|nr:NAD(P)H-dependent oxidoreductase subunit E [Spirochaetaceae bacterium]